MLQAHTLQPARSSYHRPKVVGRGNASGHGTTATRGGKGQTARSGGSRGLRLKAFKQLWQSVPKRRGFRSLREPPTAVYLADIERKFNAGEVVTPAALAERGLIPPGARAKIIVTGAITKPVKVVGIPGSAGAVAKIKAAGGEVK